MNRDDMQKLLGGYATGTLTAAEQQALFAAALEDQELFDALAREQSLRDVLQDPAAKAQLLAALDESPTPWWRAWLRPAAATVVMAGLALVAIVAVRQKAPVRVDLAMVKPSEARPEPAPPQPAEREPAAASPSSALDQKTVTSNRPAASSEKDAKSIVKEEARAAKPQFRAPIPKAPENMPPALPEPPPTAAQAPPQSALALRDALQGGVVGGAPGATPPPPRPMMRAATESATVGPSARSLYYGAANTFAPAVAETAASDKQAARRNAAVRSVNGVAASGLGEANSFAKQATNPGLKYHLQRQSAAGQFTDTDSNELKTGDTVRAVFTPNAAGHLLVMAEGSRMLLSTDVQPMVNYMTPVLDPGDRKLNVIFTRQRQAVTGSLYTPNLIQEVAADGTYVVSNPAAPVVSFSISISYK